MPSPIQQRASAPRLQEIERIYQDPWGSAALFPDAWEKFQAKIPADERHDMIAAYYKFLAGKGERRRDGAAKIWSLWEASLSHLITNPGTLARLIDPHVGLAMARIECQYFKANCFLAERQILEEVGTLRQIPGAIIQGRYDGICPARVAWTLRRAWPEAELTLVPDAGHSALEAGIATELVSATKPQRIAYSHSRI